MYENYVFIVIKFLIKLVTKLMCFKTLLYIKNLAFHIAFNFSNPNIYSIKKKRTGVDRKREPSYRQERLLLYRTLPNQSNLLNYF